MDKIKKILTGILIGGASVMIMLMTLMLIALMHGIKWLRKIKIIR